MNRAAKTKIVVVGGGTGTHIALKGLKQFQDKLEITAVVTMADSGGSTGRLRDEFGYLPVGDVRMALTALADETDDHRELLRELFTYRFSRGEGLCGHTFGNLLLTALTDILGNEVAAIEAASHLLRIGGTVLPVSTDPIHLIATYSDGTVVEGEHLIDAPPSQYHSERIVSLAVTPTTIHADAAAALRSADCIVFGPGDLYTSILANVVVPGFAEAVAESRAKILYVSNLMSRPGQTVGMGGYDHARETERYLNRPLDVVVANNAPLPPDLVAHYAVEGTAPVSNTRLRAEFSTYEADLLGSETVTIATGDVVKRSLIRHDPNKLAAAILHVVHSHTLA